MYYNFTCMHKLSVEYCISVCNFAGTATSPMRGLGSVASVSMWVL